MTNTNSQQSVAKGHLRAQAIFDGTERSRTIWLVVDGCAHARALNDLNLPSEPAILAAWATARQP